MLVELNPYVKLGLAAFLPAVLAVLVWIMEERVDHAEGHKKLPYWARQAIIGCLFGALAVLGTEWGIPINGAQMNCRDAAVLTAGLFFGAPAGIIAGVIGGVERWIAVAWGVGTFTRVACSVSTVIAGIYAAVLRKTLFENKRPRWYLALAVGVVMEVFHLTMVFVTNLSNVEKATTVVKACTGPMLIANGLSVMVGALLIALLAKESISLNRKLHISETIQRKLFLIVVAAFLVTTAFTAIVQNGLATDSANQLLELAISDLSLNVGDSLNETFVSKARTITDSVKDLDENDTANTSLAYKAALETYSVSEINYVNYSGVIIASSNEENIGFNIQFDPRTSSFVTLLRGNDVYAADMATAIKDQTVPMKYVGIAIDNGFLQIGFDKEQYDTLIASLIGLSVANRHVGKTGYLLVTDESWNVIYEPDGMELTNVAEETEITTQAPPVGETFTAVLDGEKLFCRYEESNGYFIIAVYPATEADASRDMAIYVNTYMEVLAFAVLFALIFYIIQKYIVDRMRKINEGLADITAGHLDTTIDVTQNREFEELSGGINATVDTLKKYIEEAAARIDKELEFAKSIQSSALPSVFPAFPKRKDFDIYASMCTAKEVGGDFYDFYLTRHNVLNILIADVSGKGIPAAMFMMRGKTELKSLTETGLEIGETFTKGNAALCEGNDAGMFITGWQANINLETGHVNFANAGHNLPLIYETETGKFRYLKSRVGFVLAGMEGVKYKTQELDLKPGDIIFLYTDGITEATDANNELYGDDRLLNFVNSREWSSMEELLKEVKIDVDKFVGDAPQFDDMTMLGFRYNGQPPKPQRHFDEASIADIPGLTAFVEEELEKMECPMKAQMAIDIAIDEMYSNIANYAYGDKKGPATVIVSEVEEPKGVEITFIDEGMPYNPLKKEDPDTTLAAKDRAIGGLGIFMVKKSMDDMRYEYRNEKNILTIRKNF